MVSGAEFTVIGVYAKAKGGFFGENLASEFAANLNGALEG